MFLLLNYSIIFLKMGVIYIINKMSKCGPNCKCHERSKKVIYIKNHCQNQLPTLSCHNNKPKTNPIIINLYITSLTPSETSPSGTTVLINGNGLTYAKA